jgi:hypothetical protein
MSKEIDPGFDFTQSFKETIGRYDALPEGSKAGFERNLKAERDHYQSMLDQQPEASVEYAKRHMQECS